ncbi:MAG: complement resistance protein TraT [Cetobacterium sp.]
MKKLFIATVVSLLFLTGCSSVNTVIKKRNLETQTQMSETIWLNPSLIKNKTVFLQIKNTTTKTLSIENDIAQVLLSKGYKITNNPDNTNYWLQVNVLKLNKEDLKESKPAESGLMGAGVGAALGGYNTGSLNSAIGLGAVGGLAGIAADALIEDTYYVMITDLVVSERTNKIVSNDNINLIKQGTRGVAAATSKDTTNMNKYQTRIVSTANKFNLKFEEATPVLQHELVNAISNIF